MSADGTLLVVGAPNTTVNTLANAGAAYVFIEPAGGWGTGTAQSVELSVLSSNVAQNAYFGASVAISSDGSTIIVGAPGDNGGAGAAWVFNEPAGFGGWGSTTSVSQSNELSVSGVNGDAFGASVGIYGNSATTGATIVVGAPGTSSSQGAAYVFSYSLPGGASTPVDLPTAALTLSANESFGSSVAIDSAGSTIIVGAPGYLSSQGAAYVFTYTPPATAGGTGSSNYQVRLTASDGSSGDNFGTSVAINSTTATGVTDTAVVGAPGYLSSQGAAYVFNAPAGTWAQVAELTAKGPTSGSQLGTSVAISSDASTVVAGAPGAPPASTGSYSQGTMLQFDQPSRGPNIQPWSSETQSDTYEYSKSSPTSSGYNIGGSTAVTVPSGSNPLVFAGAPNMPQTNGTTGTIYLFSGR